MSDTPTLRKRPAVLITGASGYIGRHVVKSLADEPELLERLVATDVREVHPSERLPGVVYETCDIRTDDVATLIERYDIDTVVHLAAVDTPQPTDTREPAHVSRSGNDALRCRCWRSSEAVSEQTLPRHRRASFWAQRSLSEHRVGSRRDASAGGGVTHVGFVVAAPGAVVRGNGPDEDGMASGSAVRPAVGLG